MGPMSVKAMVNKIATMNVLFLIFVCKVTGSIHTEVMNNYGAKAFCLTYDNFVSRTGKPSKIRKLVAKVRRNGISLPLVVS